MGAILMVKEKSTRTCDYLLLIYEPQSIIYILHASLFSTEWWVTFIQFQNLVQFRNTFSAPFDNQFYIIRGFDLPHNSERHLVLWLAPAPRMASWESAHIM